MSFRWQESMILPFVIIHNLELVVLVKLIEFIVYAVCLCLKVKILELEFCIYNLAIITDKLQFLLPMNPDFLDSFNDEVIGYYFGLIGVYFAVLIVVIQMYKDKKYLGMEVSKKILFGVKNDKCSVASLNWVISGTCIIFMFILKTANVSTALIFLIFLIYFVYMAYWILMHIKIMVSNNYKDDIENALINRISEGNVIDIAKSIKFNNHDELEEILDFFIKEASDDAFIKKNKKFSSVFYHLSENIFVDKANIMLLLRKINEVDYTYISRTKYVNLEINHSKLAVFIKYNFNDENFDDYYKAILKIIGNQIHLTCLGFEYSPKLFYKYFDAFINNNNLSDDNKYTAVRGLNFLRNEIAKSDDSDIRKIKYHIDYMRAIILLNVDDCINEMSKVFNEKNSGFMSYVIIITCIILYIEDKKDYVKKYNEFFLTTIENISVEKLDYYLQEIKEFIIHFENSMSTFTKKVDKESEKRLQLATQYVFIEKYIDTGKISGVDVRMSKELNSSNSIKDLNKVANFLKTHKIINWELTEYSIAIEKYQYNYH